MSQYRLDYTSLTSYFIDSDTGNLYLEMVSDIIMLTYKFI